MNGMAWSMRPTNDSCVKNAPTGSSPQEEFSPSSSRSNGDHEIQGSNLGLLNLPDRGAQCDLLFGMLQDDLQAPGFRLGEMMDETACRICMRVSKQVTHLEFCEECATMVFIKSPSPASFHAAMESFFKIFCK